MTCQLSIQRRGGTAIGSLGSTATHYAQKMDRGSNGRMFGRAHSGAQPK